MILAHGGVPGAIAESSVLVLVLLVAGLAWHGTKAEDDEVAPSPDDEAY